MPALVDEPMWDAVQQAFTRRCRVRSGRRPAGDDQYLLRGRLTCGHCRRLLTTFCNNRTRYYLCPCRYPSRSDRPGPSTCDLPDVNARGVEAEAWERLREAIEDRANLEQGFAAFQEQYASADRLRQERLIVLNEGMTTRRRWLARLVSRLGDEDGELADAIMRQAKEIEREIAGLAAERERLAARPAGLAPDEMAALSAFIEDVRAGPAEQRKLFQLLRVEGDVYADPDGVRLGQKYRFRIDWRAVVRLQPSGAVLQLGYTASDIPSK